MLNVECAQCGTDIDDNCDVYLFDNKVFDDKDCIIDYLCETNKIDHVRLVSVEDD